MAPEGNSESKRLLRYAFKKVWDALAGVAQLPACHPEYGKVASLVTGLIPAQAVR